MDLTRLTKDERSSSLKVRCSAAATRALDDLDVGDGEGVREARRAAVRLLGEVEALLQLVVALLEDLAPSARQRRPHESVMREPIVQKGNQGLPSPAHAVGDGLS